MWNNTRPNFDRNLAVVIGIDRYENPSIRNLSTAVSDASAIADHTCYDIEINRAMERHQTGEVRVIPILLRLVDWKGAPFSQLPVLPRNQQPVTSWGDRDAAFQEIAEGIREVAIKLRRVKNEGVVSSSF